MREGCYRQTTERFFKLCFGVMVLVPGLAASSALAGETHTAIRWNLGLVGGLLDFLGSQPFVLLFLTLSCSPSTSTTIRR